MYAENKFYDEVEAFKMEKSYVDVEGYETERIDVADVLPEVAVAKPEPVIQRFISKLDSIGVVYRYSDDMLDEFMRLESVVAQMKREQCVGKGERSR